MSVGVRDILRSRSR